MNILTVILIFIAVYAFSKFLLGKIETFKEVAEPLAIVIGALVAIVFGGVIK